MSHFEVGFAGEDEILRKNCRGALEGLGRLVPVPLGGPVNPGLRLLLLHHHPPYATGGKLFRAYRSELPSLPIILMGSGLDADVTAELVACGATDYVQIPFPQDVLRRKAERALFRISMPALTHSAVRALTDGGVPLGANRRLAFRAEVLGSYPAHVEIMIPPVPVRLPMTSLSLRVDDHLGGLSVSISADAAKKLPLSSWGKGTRVPIRIILPDRRDPVHGQLVVIRLRLPSKGVARKPIHLGAQYVLADPNDERVIERFWFESQRRAAALVAKDADNA